MYIIYIKKRRISISDDEENNTYSTRVYACCFFATTTTTTKEEKKTNMFYTSRAYLCAFCNRFISLVCARRIRFVDSYLHKPKTHKLIKKKKYNGEASRRRVWWMRIKRKGIVYLMSDGRWCAAGADCRHSVEVLLFINRWHAVAIFNRIWPLIGDRRSVYGTGGFKGGRRALFSPKIWNPLQTLSISHHFICGRPSSGAPWMALPKSGAAPQCLIK